MTSLKSCFNLKLFWESLKQQKYLMILHTILLFMISTLPALVIYNRAMELEQNLETYRLRDLTELLSGNNVYMMMLLTAAAVVTAIFCFSYLYKHQSMQFYHSMPHTRECLYISKFLSGVVSIIIPVILIYMVNSIMYCSYGLTEFQPLTVMVTGFFKVLIMYIFVFAVASFAASVSGNFFAQLIITAFVFLVYVISTAVIMVSFQAWFSGLTISFNYNPVYLFPPLMLADSQSLKPLEYVVIIAFSLVYFVLGLVLFKTRKSENTGKFYAFKAIPVFLKYYIAFFASLLFGALFVDAGNGNLVVSYIGYILSAFVVFIALQGIFGKSFKSMFTNLKSFVIFAVIICVIVAVPLTMPEKFDNNLPQASDVDAVQVRVYNNGYNNEYLLKEHNNIAESIKLFSYDDKIPVGESSYSYQNNNINAYLEINPDAKLFSLTYNRVYIAQEHYEEWYSKIYDSEEYKDIIAECFNPRDNDGNIIAAPYVEVLKHRYYNIINKSDLISKEQYRKLKEAFIKDFENNTYEDIKDSYVYALLHVHDTDLKIYKCYEETMKVLNETGILNNTTITAEGLSKIEVTTWSYDKGDNIVVYETQNPEIMSEILEYSVEYGNNIDVHAYYENGDKFDFSANFENLPAHIKNSIANY